MTALRLRNSLAAGLLAGVMIGCSQATTARELAVSEDQLIATELAMVGTVPMTGVPVVVLRAPDSGAFVPIFIGVNEARAILMAQRNIQTPRPMTHDLAASLITGLDGTLTRVIVDELRDGTYLGALEIAVEGRDTPVLIDTRPSDGLALAVRSGAQILVAPAVLEAGEDVPFEGLGDDEVVTALGMTVVEASDELRQALGLPDEKGVLVSHSRGMAAIAGLVPGALILSVNEAPVASPTEFLEQVGRVPRDESARIGYWHDGERREASVPVDVPEREGRQRRREAI